MPIKSMPKIGIYLQRWFIAAVILKAQIVAADERESGKRALLNFGHTFGHVIETHQGYGKWLHGEAVAAGMVQAAQMSYRLGLIRACDVERIENIIKKISSADQAS